MTGFREAIHAAPERKSGLLRRFRHRSLSFGGQAAPRNDVEEPLRLAGMRRTTLHPRHCERSEAIHAATKKVWIASSQELLAMTEYCVGRWAPSPSLRAQRSNPCRRTKKEWIASSQE